MSAPANVAFVRAVLEPELRAGPLGPDGELRIALVRGSNASGTSHTDAVFTALADSRPAGRREEVRPIVVEAPGGGDTSVFLRPAAEIAAFAPHVIVDAGASTGVLLAIERAWSTGSRPRYVYGGVDDEVLRELAVTWPDIRARFTVIGTRRDRVHAKIAAHYAATFGTSEQAELSLAPYDAFYVLAYAAFALGDAPLTGRALARAIARLVPPGEPIDVGPAGIYPAIEALGRGGNIDLRGAITDLDFDLATGDPGADFAAFCLDEGGSRLLATEARYDRKARTFVGAWRCP